MHTTDDDPIYVRWLIRRDMPEVLAIENDLSDSLTEKEIIEHIRCRDKIGMVVEFDGAVAGYVIYELLRERLWIIRLAISSEYAGKGCGSALIQKLISKLHVNRRHSLCVQVDDTNYELIGFLKSQGFSITSMEDKSFWMCYSVEKRLKVNLKNRIKS